MARDVSHLAHETITFHNNKDDHQKRCFTHRRIWTRVPTHTESPCRARRICCPGLFRTEALSPPPPPLTRVIMAFIWLQERKGRLEMARLNLPCVRGEEKTALRCQGRLVKNNLSSLLLILAAPSVLHRFGCSLTSSLSGSNSRGGAFEGQGERRRRSVIKRDSLIGGRWKV